MIAADPYRNAVAVPRPAAPGPPMICRRCGVVAPSRGVTCECCKRPLAETRMQAPAVGPELFWVAVRCGFMCNSCRFVAPLDGLDVDGAVECAQCGLRQRFEVPLWSQALQLAHAVGDLGGPWPEGRAPHPAIWIGGDNPYRAVGDSKTFEELGALGGVLQVQAAPGHPVCRKCNLPLTTTLTAPGTVSARCPGCGDSGTWQLPEQARGLYEPLVGVLSDDQRTDRPKVISQMTGGAVALKCPGCGAPLTLQGTDRVQSCPYCRVTYMVPWRRLARMRNEIPEPEIWWLLMSGPSTARLSLEAPSVPIPRGLGSARKLIKRTEGPTDIGQDPGVYEAPVPPGRNWPQILLTVAAGLIALAFGYLVAGK